MEEQKKIRIIVIMDWLKYNINPSFDNKEYQNWLKRNLLDKKYKFRNWVIDSAKKKILKELDGFGKKLPSPSSSILIDGNNNILAKGYKEDSPKVCPNCTGSGLIVTGLINNPTLTHCENCKGTGKTSQKIKKTETL